MSEYVGKAVGLRNLTFWPITGVTEGAITYGSPVKIARAITATLTPTQSEAMLESEDGVEDDISQVTGYGLAIDVSQINHAARAAIFGHQVDEDGGLIFNENDTPVWGALAFRTPLTTEGGSGTKYAYHVMYRGRFKEFPENFETRKRESMAIQTHTGIQASFYSDEKTGNIRYVMREDHENFNTTKAGAWFTTVQQPTLTPEG